MWRGRGHRSFAAILHITARSEPLPEQKIFIDHFLHLATGARVALPCSMQTPACLSTHSSEKTRQSFVDVLSVTVHAGNGGSGCSTIWGSRAKGQYQPPDGGNGGPGGDVYVRASSRSADLQLGSVRIWKGYLLLRDPREHGQFHAANGACEGSNSCSEPRMVGKVPSRRGMAGKAKI